MEIKSSLQPLCHESLVEMQRNKETCWWGDDALVSTVHNNGFSISEIEIMDQIVLRLKTQKHVG